MGEFEEKYNDTLRSMELTLVRPYRQLENLTDWETERAVNGLIRTYAAEQRGRKPPNLRLNALTQSVYDQLHVTCEGWLGRQPLLDEYGNAATLDENALKVSEVVACLKRVRKSIQMWQKEAGRRGYFAFIDQFLPE